MTAVLTLCVVSILVLFPVLLWLGRSAPGEDDLNPPDYRPPREMGWWESVCKPDPPPPPGFTKLWVSGGPCCPYCRNLATGSIHPVQEGTICQNCWLPRAHGGTCQRCHQPATGIGVHAVDEGLICGSCWYRN